MMHESLARKLRVLRAARGITLAEAEELTGVTRETLGALEHGQRGAYTSTLEKIADGYGTTVSALLAAEEPEVSPAGKASAPPETGPSAELPQRRFPSEAREPEELSGWARSALEESKFVERFEQAKLASEEAARQFHREEVEAEKQAANRLRELQARNAPWGEILAAGRDREIAAARMSATAFLWTEILGGRDVSALDPVEIVGDALAARRDLFAEEGASRPPKPASGASEVEAG